MKNKRVKKYGILIISAAIIAGSSVVAAAGVIANDKTEEIQSIKAEPIEEPEYKVIGSDHLDQDQEDEAVSDQTDAGSGSGSGQQAKQYSEVKFVALPVDMNREDQEEVFRICQNNDVAFPLVMAIIEHESQFNPSARSITGDSGLMQINDVNAESLAEQGFTDLYDLHDNVSAGVYMLQELYCKYEDTTFVLMAYNAGEKGAKEQQKEGITETDYTNEIESRAEVFTEYIDERLK